LPASTMVLLVLWLLTLMVSGAYLMFVYRRQKRVHFDAMMVLARQYPDPVLIAGENGRIIAFSPAACELLGYSAKALRGLSVEALMPEKYQSRHRQQREQFMGGRSGKAMDNEVTCMSSSGENIPSITRVRTFTMGGQRYGMVSIRDLRPFKDRENLLKSLSEHDPLTGLANRRLFAHDYQQEWQRALRCGDPLTVLMIDVDQFKQYNDYYGHLAGDECLKTIANILLTTVKRSTDTVARYGGEEFICCLAGLSVAEGAAVAERFRAAVEAERIPNQPSSVSPWITVSVGVAGAVPMGAEEPQSLIRRADVALYQAKADGRNRVTTETCIPVTGRVARLD